MRTCLFFVFFLIINTAMAAEPDRVPSAIVVSDSLVGDSAPLAGDSLILDASHADSAMEGRKVKHKKLKAVILAITLGHFGVHRLYLGTDAKIPVVYSLTLGGGLGLLPLIDTFAILFSKDLSKFENNPRVFMWINNR